MSLQGREERFIWKEKEYFEVMRNLEKPFVVQSEAMQVRVLGTVFNLKSDKAKMSASSYPFERRSRGER